MRTRTLKHRVIVLITVLTTLPACMSYRASHPSALAGTGTSTLRVSIADGNPIELQRARLEGDSIVGWVVTGTAFQPIEARRAVAVEDIQDLEVSQLDVGNTVLVIGGIAFVVAAFMSWAVSTMSVGFPGLGYGG